MEEIEPPIEQVHEEIHHHAHHASETWVSWVAVSTAALAALAAITALLSGMHANEAVMEQIKSANKWAYYQAKSIKTGQLKSKMEILGALDKPANQEDAKKLKEYDKEMDEIKEKAEHDSHESTENFELHETYARGVTLFQIAITIAAISVLTKKKGFWLFGLAFACVGVGFFVTGLKTDVPRFINSVFSAHAEDHH